MRYLICRSEQELTESGQLPKETRLSQRDPARHRRLNMNLSPPVLKCLLGLIVFFGCTVRQFVAAQELTGSIPVNTLKMASLNVAPEIDGNIGDSEWSGATIVDGYFVQNEPEYGNPSPLRTTVRIGQTETSLYVAFEAFDPEPSRLAAALTQRDDELDHDDSVAVLLDSFGDGRTAYLFRTNALATQQDGRIADNGRTVDLRWDAAWHSAATRHDDRWTVEFEIPFSILKYAESDRGWGINFVRTMPRRLETSLWSGPSEAVFRVTGFGELQGLKAPKPEDPWQLIPYILGSLERGKGAEFEIGADVRWRPSSQLGIDLTVNPDFALIEADVETINLSRFELRIPEKRPFFLEGNEMFNQRLRQFYSRRIGDITWGTKTSGKLGRTDFSAIATSESLALPGGVGEDSADYGVLRLQHSLGRGSNVGLLAANRNFQGDDAGSVGLDTTMFFTDTLGMTAQLLRVHGPTADGGLAWFVRPSWDTSTSHFHVRFAELETGIQDDFNAVGFLTDDDRKEFDTNVRHTFWFDDGPIENVRPMINYNRYESQEGVLRSWEIDAEIEVVFRNGWELELEHTNEFKLFEKEFRNDRTILNVGWDGRDGRSVSVHAGNGFNFDNDLVLYGAKVRWPFGDRWRLSYELTRLELDPDLETETTTIHVFDVLYAFHPDLFVKLFLQTNSAIDKENIQAQWVWRFKPPFGSLQLAFQRGTSEQGQQSQQGDTFFTKFAWVF